MSNIDKQLIRDDIVRRKSMPDFGISSYANLERLRVIQETQRSFGLEVVEALLDELEAKDRRIEEEIGRANREHHRGFMMACGHLKEHSNVHYADAAEMEIAALRNRINELESAPPAQVSVPDLAALDNLAGEILNHAMNCERRVAVAYTHCAHRLAEEVRDLRAAMLQGADEKPELTVWYGSMPESNGKANWTAILHRKGEGLCMDGFTIDRSEYPGRVLYAADRVRYLIGEKSERPSILDYDADAHSGYVKPGNSPVIQDGWIPVSERMPDDTVDADGGATCYLVFYAEGRQPNGGSNVQVSNVTYLRRWHEGMITHWMPLPAAPQQEVK